jgi:two-component system, OmpR family, phosphate regulon response regulator OmpR
MLDKDAMRTGYRGLILTIDDVKYVRMMVRKSLEPIGFRIVEAEDGWEAEKVMEECRGAIQLILCDIVMPGQDGITTLSNIRAKGFKTPVIMLSANSHRKNLWACYRLGISGFVTKPFDRGSLRAKVLKVLSEEAGKTAQPARTG